MEENIKSNKEELLFEPIKVVLVFNDLKLPFEKREREQLFQRWKLNLVCISNKKLFYAVDNEVFYIPLYPGLPILSPPQKLPYTHVFLFFSLFYSILIF